MPGGGPKPGPAFGQGIDARATGEATLTAIHVRTLVVHWSSSSEAGLVTDAVGICMESGVGIAARTAVDLTQRRS